MQKEIFALFTGPIPVADDFTDKITSFIDHESCRKRPYIVNTVRARTWVQQCWKRAMLVEKRSNIPGVVSGRDGKHRQALRSQLPMKRLQRRHFETTGW